MKKIKLGVEKGPVAEAIEERGTEAVLGDKPLPPPPPQFNKPVGEPPPPVKAPEGFDEIFAMALQVRSGKPGFADFWARMAQADALNRLAINFERFNEFLGVFDNDDSEDPDDEPTRASDLIVDGLVGAVIGVKEEMLAQLPEPLRKQAEEQLLRSMFGDLGKS